MGALTTKEERAVTVATSGSATEPLGLVELPAPSLGPRDVRVLVRAAGVNPVDWKMRAGGPLRFAYRFVGPSGPLVIGVDFAGEVIEAGPEADLAPGDRVVGGTDFSRKQRGSYATEVTVRDGRQAPARARHGSHHGSRRKRCGHPQRGTVSMRARKRPLSVSGSAPIAVSSVKRPPMTRRVSSTRVSRALVLGDTKRNT